MQLTAEQAQGVAIICSALEEAGPLLAGCVLQPAALATLVAFGRLLPAAAA